MTVDLYIVRHGNTFAPGDTVRRIGARSDLPLVASGREQAKRLADAFSGFLFSAAWSSPLRRATETAQIILSAQTAPQIILSAQTAPPPLGVAGFLTEIDHGPDEGVPEADVRDRVGEAALARWEASGEPPPGWAVDPAALTTAWGVFFERLVGASDGGGGRALAVTSNGVARFALAAAGIRHPGKLRTGAVGRLRLAAGEAPLLLDWDVRP